jgi:hypothetical protein
MRVAVSGVETLLKVSQALSQCAGRALILGVHPLGHHISIELMLMWCPICGHHVNWAYLLQKTWVPPALLPNDDRERQKDPLEQSVSLIRGV